MNNKSLIDKITESINVKFGKLIITSFYGYSDSKSGKYVKRRPLVNVKCDCGKEKVIIFQNILRGLSKSCGCGIGKGNRTHGFGSTKIYNTWDHMMRRCYNEKEFAYNSYGGRGIKVCQRWHDITLFAKDMFPAPSKTHTIDRIDVNGDYEPNNCKWATRKEQAANKRNNVKLTLNGRTEILAYWQKLYNIPHATLWYRINRGWDLQKALTTPPLNKNS